MRFVFEDEGQKKTYELHQGEVKIGRDPSCEIATTNRSVSRKHVVCTIKGTTIIVKDENSGNGMFVNDVRMPEAVLRNGDVLRAGKFALTFQGEDDDRTIVGAGGTDQEGTMVDGGVAAAPPPPRRAASPAQMEAAGHKTAPLDDLAADLAKMAAAPPPPKKPKSGPAEPAPPGKLKVVKGMAASVRDLKGRTGLGTQDDNAVVLSGDGISRNHAEIFARDGKWVVKDLASKNGVYVNGKKVEEQVLADGDSIQIGSVTMAFVGPAASGGGGAAAAASAPVAAGAAPAKAASAPGGKSKKKLIIAVAAVFILGAVGLMMMPNPDDKKGGTGGGTGEDPKAAADAAFAKKASAAWEEVLNAVDANQLDGASLALSGVEKLYSKGNKDTAEIRAWGKIIKMYDDAGPKCKNLNGQQWDEFKRLFDDAVKKGEYEAEYATSCAKWATDERAQWEFVSKAQDSRSSKKWKDAVDAYNKVAKDDFCYGELAQKELKATMEEWKKGYLEQLNQYEANSEYQKAVDTYAQMKADLPDTKGDKKLFDRYLVWQGNVDASNHVNAARTLVNQQKYEDAIKELDMAHTSEEKLTGEINRLRAIAESGGKSTQAGALYKAGKADEALALLGDVAEGSPLAPVKAKIAKVFQAYKDATAAEQRKDYETASRWWTEIISNEEDKDNFFRQIADQKAGFKPDEKATELVRQAAEKMGAEDYAGARTLVEEALSIKASHEGAQKLATSIVKAAANKFNMLNAKWKSMDPKDALKQAEGIKGMLRATDTTEWGRVNGLLETIRKAIEGGK